MSRVNDTWHRRPTYINDLDSISPDIQFKTFLRNRNPHFNNRAKTKGVVTYVIAVNNKERENPQGTRRYR